MFGERSTGNWLTRLGTGVFAVAVVVLAPNPAQALMQDQNLSGAPILTRYSAEDYPVAPRHLSVLSDDQGRVFVGTLEGVLLYSAGRFEKIELPNDASVRTMAFGPEKRLYVAAYDHFGYLREDDTGEWGFVDLDERFSEAPGPHKLGDVWQVVVRDDGVYFLTAERLYRIGNDDRTESWPTPGDTHSLLDAGPDLLLRVQQRGLMRFQGGRFELVEGGELMVDARANTLLPAEQGYFLGTRNLGFYHYQDGKVRKYQSPVEDWLRSVEPYCGVVLPDGSYAIGALNGEVIHLDRQLNLLERFVASAYPISDLTVGHEGGLWITTEGDLVRAAWPSPWTLLTEADGLLGSIEDSAFVGDKRYVATSMGFFESTADQQGRVRFQRRDDLGTDEVWDLQTVDEGLLLAQRSAVYLLRAGKLEKLVDADYPYELVPSRFDPDRVYVLADEGLLILRREGSNYLEQARFPFEGVGLYSLVELADDDLMAGNFRGLPLRLQLSADRRSLLKHEAMGAAYGVEVPDGEISNVSRYREQIMLGTPGGLLVFDGQRFRKHDFDGLAALVKRPSELTIREHADGRRFAYTSRELFMQQSDSTWAAVPMQTPLARGFVDVTFESNGLVSVIGWGALLTLDTQRASGAPGELKALIHRIETTSGRREVSRLSRVASKLQIEPHRLLHLEYGVNSAERGVEFRTWLVGFEPGFSEWSATNARDFSGLAPKDYEFRIEARTPSKRKSAPLSLHFKVLPRWYQTPWAAWGASALVLALASLLAWLWGRWRSRQLHARNVELERTIEAHTRELEVANQRLAKLAVQDGLTGVTNRRGFEQAFTRMWNRLSEARIPLAVLMIDVDYFKQFNDAHGHLAGDEVLRTIAKALEHDIHEPNEVLARFGGEEFVILLANTQIDEAITRAHTLRARCEEVGKANGITVSIGVAACVPRGGLKPSQLIDEADAALYRAKKAGRNRIERGRTV